jgi:hypothetical protein
MRKFAVTLFNKIIDKETKVREISWEDFTKRVTEPEIRNEEEVGTFIPAKCAYGYPHYGDPDYHSMLVFDINYGIELNDLRKKLLSLESAFSIFSTYHHKRKTESNPRAQSSFRVCIPLNWELYRDFVFVDITYEDLCAEVSNRLGLHANTATMGYKNFHYKPTIAYNGAPYEYHNEEHSDFFDYDKFLEEKVQVKAESQDKVITECEKDAKIICLDDVEIEEIDWLWFPYIAMSKLTIISGEEGLGKSWLTCAFASAVSNGYGFPLSDEKFEPGNVLMLSAEYGLGDTIKPRLVSLNANTKRVYALNESITFDEKGLGKLEEYVSQLKPKLVIVDPLFAYTSAKTDVNSANQSRAVSTPLAAIAAKHNCAIVLVRHIGKSKGMGDSRAAGLGSIDWRAAVRSELLVGKNAENEKAIIQTKTNLGKFGDSIGFVIEDSADGALFRWTGKSSLTEADLLSIPEQRKSGGGMSKAESFLLNALGEGERPASEIAKEALTVGLTEQNLRTACEKLGVKKRKGGNSHTEEQKWFWRLPDDMSLI